MPSYRPRVTRICVTPLMSVLSLAGCTQDATGPAPSATASPGLNANFRLLIHCGVRYAAFDGDTWEAVAPIPTIPEFVTDGKGNMSNRNDVAGEMLRLSATEARFTTTDPPAGLVVHFVRSTATIPGCA